MIHFFQFIGPEYQNRGNFDKLFFFQISYTVHHLNYEERENERDENEREKNGREGETTLYLFTIV